VPDKLSFPKSRRLTRTVEFDRIRREGTAWRGALFTIAVAQGANSEEKVRVGIIASRKVGAAVVRNRVRRRIREIFRKNQHALKTGIWLVIILSARASRATYSQLEDEWLRLARRASILTP
jgi:ribonuclease P protein component